MDFFKKYLTQIRTQLAGLTISQRLLIGMLIVVMVATIFFTVTFSAKPEMVTLIPQAMSAEEINRVEMFLKGKYDYAVAGDKVMVPAEKAYAIRGELFAAQALPKDTTAAFAEIIKANNLFKTNEMSAREWNYATQEVLTRMLKYFPYIEDGTVIIARGEKAGIGREAVPSSASVTVKVRGNESLSGNQVVAIVDMIRGAVPGLKREDVHVTDGQRVYHAPSSDSPMPTDLLAFKKTLEDNLAQKLWSYFGHLGNVKIAVNVVPDLTVRRQERETYDPKGVVKATKRETVKESNTAEGSGGAGNEPGVRPNTSVALGSTSTSGGSRSNSSTNDSTTETDVRFSKMIESAILPPGTEIRDLTAGISLPRSYFVATYRRQTKDQNADPSDEQLQPTIDKLMKQTQESAMAVIGAKSQGSVRVDWFDDTIVPRGVELATAGGSFGSSGSISGMLSQYAKQAVLAAVAIGVLLMMLMMVKRAVPSTGSADIDPSVFFGNMPAGAGGVRMGRKKGEPGALDVEDDVIGEANSSDAVLQGIELDDETLQSRKMVDEVSTMIKDNPENAAALVKRWMSKGK